MATNIPLPGVPGESFLKGIDTGSTLFTRMMAPVLHREAQQRQWVQHQQNLALQQQAQARLAHQHQQNYGLQLAAQKRLEQRAADLHREALRKSDPRYKIEELKSLMDYVRGGGLGGQAASQPAQEAESYMPTIGKQFGQGESYLPSLPEQFGQEESYINPIGMQEQSPESFVPTINGPLGGEQSFVPSAIKPFVGASNMPSIGGRMGNQQSILPAMGFNAPQTEEQIPQLMTEMPAQKPAMKMDKFEERIINGWLKKNYGVDFNQLTPEEKQEAQMALYKAKREYDIANPKPSASGISAADRAADRALRRDQLNERIAHNRVLEKNATPEQKVLLRGQLDELEVAKKKLIEENKSEIAKTTTLNKEEGKQLAKMEERASAGIESSALMNELKELASNPVLDQIRQHPILGHYEFEYYKNRGNSEQKTFLGDFETVTTKLIADTAKGLNTRFTDKDLQLAKDMKINAKDTPESMRAKAAMLIYLHEVGQQRLEKAIDIAHEENIAPYKAFKKADSLINGPEIRKHIRESVNPGLYKLPAGITEDDITATHEATGMSREKIIAEYKRRQGIK